MRTSRRLRASTRRPQCVARLSRRQSRAANETDAFAGGLASLIAGVSSDSLSAEHAHQRRRRRRRRGRKCRKPPGGRKIVPKGSLRRVTSVKYFPSLSAALYGGFNGAAEMINDKLAVGFYSRRRALAAPRRAARGGGPATSIELFKFGL